MKVGWRKASEKYLEFNLAAFLTVAQQNTWFTQAVWYELHQGFVPCTNAACDDTTLGKDFYADFFKKPLGQPQGLRERVGPYKWTREFKHATVTLDLDNPVAGSSIKFH